MPSGGRRHHTPPPAPVDVVPNVVSVTPVAGTVDRPIGTNVTATFDIAMDAATITSSTFTLVDSTATPVAASVSYNASTRVATLNPTSDLDNDEVYTATVSTAAEAAGVPLAADFDWSFTTVSVVATPTFGIEGYAKAANVTGGDGGTVYNVSTWAAYKAALQASGTRIIYLHGNAVLSGGGDAFSVSNGNLTIDGTDWTGVLKDYKVVFRCSNVIITEMAMRPGEGATGADSADRRALTFNPPTGGGIAKILVKKCSLAWGPDVVFSAINQTTDMTIQECILGPSLQGSNDPDHGADQTKGYGPNITVPAGGDAARYPKRITYYRNLMVMNNKRNFRGHGIDGFDVVNNVLYDWGDKSGHGNPRGANVMNNVYKKGPQTTNAEGWDSELFGLYTSYFGNSVYYSGNIGRTAAGASLTLTESFASGVRRTTPYANGPTDASHGGLVVATADDALFDDVVANAGRTYQDDIDTLIKAHAMAGTDDGDFYQGAGFGGPHPSWTAGP